MNRLGMLVALVAVMVAGGSALTTAAPPTQGVPQQLGDIVVELQAIGEQLQAIADATGSGARVEGVSKAEGLIVNPVSGSSHDLVSLTGPGSFVSARLTKQGGATGLTAVRLEIDGRIIVGRNFIALKNLGMTQSNPFGIVILSSSVIDSVTIGFPQPLAFESSLKLRAIVNEAGVVQMIGTVIHGD